MIILGIDPGIARMGWALINKEGQKVTALDYGCFETEKDIPAPQRLKLVYDKVKELIAEFHPTEFAIEDLFFKNNAKTAFVVGQARGVMLLAAAEANLNPTVYTPLQIKMALTGYGHAEKRQVGQMVKTILKLPSVPTPDDTADAVAIALTHAFTIRK